MKRKNLEKIFATHEEKLKEARAEIDEVTNALAQDILKFAKQARSISQKTLGSEWSGVSGWQWTTIRNNDFTIFKMDKDCIVLSTYSSSCWPNHHGVVYRVPTDILKMSTKDFSKRVRKEILESQIKDLEIYIEHNLRSSKVHSNSQKEYLKKAEDQRIKLAKLQKIFLEKYNKSSDRD